MEDWAGKEAELGKEAESGKEAETGKEAGTKGQCWRARIEVTLGAQVQGNRFEGQGLRTMTGRVGQRKRMKARMEKC